MAGQAVQLRVGGQTYRVVSSADEADLRRLAAVVDAKLAALTPPGRVATPQALLLAAMALAHELEEERARGAQMAERARSAFGRVLARVDAVLDVGAPGAGASEG
jgi:cell division protein ZapA